MVVCNFVTLSLESSAVFDVWPDIEYSHGGMLCCVGKIGWGGGYH